MSDQSNREWALETLSAFMATQGKKTTRQRKVIVDVFLDLEGHLTLQDLLGAVQEKDSGVGFATVYRTMKMLVEAGIAKERHFGSDHALYELVHHGEHHDHLICSWCGNIFEFEDELVEARQAEIAKGLGMRISGHCHELYAEPLKKSGCGQAGCKSPKK